MNAAYRHVEQALTGVVHMLMGRTDFHGRFDVSSRGVAASFGAAVLAIPFSGFAALVENTLARLTEGQLEPSPQLTIAYVAARWAAMWAYFPLVAAATTAIIGRREYFAPWIVVQNWTHLLVVIIQVVPLALIVAGAPRFGATLLTGSIMIMVYAYVAAAKAALDAGWRLAIPCGAINLACVLLIQEALYRLLLVPSAAPLPAD